LSDIEAMFARLTGAVPPAAPAETVAPGSTPAKTPATEQKP
jgi:hypothetical protein